MKEEKSKKNYQFVIIIMLFRKIDTFHLHLSTSFLGVLFKLCKKYNQYGFEMYRISLLSFLHL